MSTAANERLRRWRDKQRAERKCVSCTRKALKGGRRCREHRDAQREVQQKYRDSRRDARAAVSGTSERLSCVRDTVELSDEVT